MIFPLGHERTTVRRLPWVTFSIMGLCLLAFIGTVASLSSADNPDERADDAIRYFLERPYLKIDLEFFQRATKIPGREVEPYIESRRSIGPDPPEDPELRAYEQEVLDGLVASVFMAAEDSPYYRWGLIPSQPNITTYFTHMFIHGGLLHLLGNMFFFYLAAPFIEDAWGRPIFAGFYLLAGLVAAGMFAARYPELDGPMVGASGAVAGMMGAFLIRFWKTKIKFFYWFFVFVGTFTAPAWFMLPLWLLRELFFAQAMDVVAPESGGGGVAHWAHVWGFVFGVVVAVVMKKFDIEERFLHDKIEQKITLVDNTGVDDAMEALRLGETGRAEELLRAAIQQSPGNTDACIAMWTLMMQTDRAPEGAPYQLKVIRKAVQENDLELLIPQWATLMQVLPEAQIETTLALRVAETFERAGERIHVETAIDAAVRSLAADAPVGIVVRLARVAALNHSPNSFELIRRALEHPEIPPESRAELEGLRAELDANRIDVIPEDPNDVGLDEGVDVADVSKVVHTLQVMESVPIALQESKLALDAKGTRRTLDLEKIQAIAVAGVAREEGRKVLLIDLLLDPPWGDREAMRVVRLSSNSFDPRKLVGGEKPGDAFKVFIQRLLDVTGAVPLPDPDAALGQPFATFGSLAEYQKEVLDVGATPQ